MKIRVMRGRESRWRELQLTGCFIFERAPGRPINPPEHLGPGNWWYREAWGAGDKNEDI